MADILSYIEMNGDVPTTASLELISGARALSEPRGRVVAVVVDPAPGLQLDPLRGADEIVIVRSGLPQDYTSETHVAALRQVVEEKHPDLVLIANSSIGLDLAGSLAAATERTLLTYCIAITLREGVVGARSQLYGGRAEAEAEGPLPAVVAVNAGTFKAHHNSTAPAAIVERCLDTSRARRVAIEAVETASTGDVDITKVDRLVCVGRGIGEEGNIELARELAATIGGELVASRPIVDLGWVAKGRQVGKSGKTVTPKLYLAIGVSGAPEHLEGMRDAELIIAVNTDPSAPIFSAAHAGTTCDAIKLLPVLTRRLKEVLA